MLVLSLQYMDELDNTDCENATASYHFPDWGDGYRDDDDCYSYGEQQLDDCIFHCAYGIIGGGSPLGGAT